MGGGRGKAGDRKSDKSVPFTFTGNRPLMTLFVGFGVSAPSLDSSSAANSASDLSAMAFCFRYRLICDVVATSSISFSFENAPFGGLIDLEFKTSLGGNRTGFPSNFKTCRDDMSAKHSGRSSIRFFCTDKTFKDVKAAISGGNIRSLFRPRSNISRDLS